MTPHPFDAIQLPPFPAKPRSVGLTSIIDKGLAPAEAQQLAAVAGEWMDVVKLGWGTSRLQPGDVLARKIQSYKAAGIAPATGGTLLEVAFAQDCVPAFLRGARNVGFEIIEVSNGVHPMSETQKLELIRQIRGEGFRVWSEVGKKDPTEDAGLTIEDRLSAIESELEAGAEKVILEARESGTVGIFDSKGKPVVELLSAVAENVGIEHIVFEAPQKSQQVWLIHQLGRCVNLGNIPANEAIPVATLRMGLRGDTFADVHMDQVDVHLAVGINGALEAKRRGGVVVLIDALRASATMIAALAHGMSSIKPVATAEDCVGEVTAGERGGHKLPNTRHTNSPTEIMQHDYRGKQLVLTTTNGVECLLAASGPRTEILVGSTINRTAAAREAERLARERRCPITLLISGRHNKSVIEDELAAGEIFRAFRAATLKDGWLRESENLYDDFKAGESGQNLLKLGGADDILFCAQRDIYDVVPVWRNGLLVPMTVVDTPAMPLQDSAGVDDSHITESSA